MLKNISNNSYPEYFWGSHSGDNTAEAIYSELVVANMLFVSADGDDVSGDGSVAKPFATIAKAVSTAVSGNVIYIFPGTFTGVDLPDGVSILGCAMHRTIISGDWETGALPVDLANFVHTGTLTVNAVTNAANLYSSSGAIIGNKDINAFNWTIDKSSGVCVTFNSGIHSFISGTFQTGDASAVIHSGGNISFQSVQLVNQSAASPTLISSGGTFSASFARVLNLGGGKGIEASNGATPSLPNALASMFYFGALDFGGSHCVLDNMRGTGPITGTNLSYAPASQTQNDSGVTGVTVKNALDNLIPKDIINAKGDLITGTADDTPSVLAVGADGKYLRADSGAATGLKWDEVAELLDEYGSLVLEQELPWSTTETAGPAVIQWNDIAISETGQYVTASGWDRLYTSNNYGATFTARGGSGNTWRGTATSGDGQYQLAAFMNLNGKVYRSSNYGVTWAAVAIPDKMWIDVAISKDGQYQLASTYDFVMRPGVVYMSNDYGATWSEIVALAGVTYGQADISEDGQFMILSDASGNVKYSSDYGANWSTILTVPSGYVQGLDMSMDGQHITAGVDAGSLWITHNGGISWKEYARTEEWFAIALSHTGQIQLAASASSSQDVLFSADYGENWVQLTGDTLTSSEYTSIAMNGDGMLMITGQWTTGTQARLKVSRHFAVGNIYTSGMLYGDVSYTPENSAHWLGDPTTIKNAIDRLAAWVYTHSGNIAIP